MSAASSPVLVTGATGLLGNNVVRLLHGEARPVRCLVRPGSDPRPLAGLDVETVEGDLLEPASVERAVDGTGAVIHAAARVDVGTRDREAYRAVNVGGSRTVARACRRAGVRMVHVSSVDTLAWGTAEEPSDEKAGPSDLAGVPYVETKRSAERVVFEEVDAGLDAVVVHPGFLLGPWDWKPSSGRLVLAVARGAGRFAPPGGNDFCHAVDVGRGVVAALDRGRRGERYILSGPALAYREAFALIARVTGAPPPLATLPAGLLRLVGRAGDAVGRLLGREVGLNSGSARIASLPHHFDSEKARDELDYRSRPPEVAVRDAWRWLCEHGYG